MINPTANWNEFAKEFNELTTKNLEMINKFWKTNVEQSNEHIVKNTEQYFNHLNGNINYLNTMWKSYIQGKSEMQKLYTERMETLKENVTKTYRDMTQSK
ncbi:MAG TPA: hypothetical protein PKK26_08480 [Candidatus Wallbacteria bacterium]|nr:hypothetical protein [Candidatus Wallbacteria bacterium]